MIIVQICHTMFLNKEKNIYNNMGIVFGSSYQSQLHKFGPLYKWIYQVFCSKSKNKVSLKVCRYKTRFLSSLRSPFLPLPFPLSLFVILFYYSLFNIILRKKLKIEVINMDSTFYLYYSMIVFKWIYQRISAICRITEMTQFLFPDPSLKDASSWERDKCQRDSGELEREREDPPNPKRQERSALEPSLLPQPHLMLQCPTLFTKHTFKENYYFKTWPQSIKPKSVMPFWLTVLAACPWNGLGSYYI